MFMCVKKINIITGLVAFTFWGCVLSPVVLGQQVKSPFTVADDIGLTLFAPQGGGAPELHFSPDNKYFAVWSERGRLDRNQVDDSLRFYRTQDIELFLKNPGLQLPEPAWIVAFSGKRYPVIWQWRWLADSSGVAFLSFDDAMASQQLILADLRRKKVEPLTSPTLEVRAFDIRDRQHYVYAVADHFAEQKKKQAERQAGAIVGTGVGIWELLFPDDPIIRWGAPYTKELWAVVDGKRFEVEHEGKPPVFDEQAMALSPDGRSLVTRSPVEAVPPSWQTLYPPPQFLSYPGAHPIHAGHGTASQYVRIDLRSGSVESLTEAPSMDAVGILSGSAPAWSSDGQTVLLPGTFLKPKQNEEGRPCIAIVNLKSKSRSCVATLKEGYSKNLDPVDNYHRSSDIITDARFAPDDEHRLLVTFDTADGSPGRTQTYQLNPLGVWQADGETIGQQGLGPGGLKIRVKESFSEPPLLTAAMKETWQVLWDPNPQLKDVRLAEVSIYRWRDAEGRDWEGGLYKPNNYQPSRRYPLVIQTHGFVKSAFSPSGLFSTAFAAQELAAQGIMVLQAEYGDRMCEIGSPREGPCEAGVMESAAKQLVSEGLVDPEEVGIIGFSRTCYYVMEMLTTNSLHLKAASITDGVMADYFDYIRGGGDEGAEEMIGAKPFGEGLQQWLKRSPSFNLDKVNTPLLVNALSRLGVLPMWSPYAQLHYLKKPVDLVILDMHEHILTNPAARMASQVGSVDWFRFWLQGYEDPDPAKAGQYARWRELRKLQEQNAQQPQPAKAPSVH